MIDIEIRPVWRFRSGGRDRAFDFQLVAILGELDASGKLTQAAEKAGYSYRHAWNLIAEWEEFFGAPLVVKERGKGSTLSELGERLLWAGRRAHARLAPDLDNLAAEFARSLNESLHDREAALVVQASHDFAVAALRDLAGAQGLDIELQYRGSFDALAALRRGECDVAGFHVAQGPLAPAMTRRYAECLPLGDFRLVSFVERSQGFMVLPGNPKRIDSIGDLCRADVRMVNRQRGSGTRALLEFLISSGGIDRSRIRGYDTEEITHAAVAAMIAGHQADVGVGVEAAAAQYRLGFVPLVTERYYLACRRDLLEAPALRKLLDVLRSPGFADTVRALPGYTTDEAGKILPAFDVFPFHAANREFE